MTVLKMLDKIYHEIDIKTFQFVFVLTYRKVVLLQKRHIRKKELRNGNARF